MKAWEDVAFGRGYCNSLFSDMQWCRNCMVGGDHTKDATCWLCGKPYDTKYEWQLPLGIQAPSGARIVA